MRTVICNLYAQTLSQDEIRSLAEVLNDHTGNLTLMPDICPDSAASIVRNGPNSRELVLARRGMPSPTFALKGRKVDRGGRTSARRHLRTGDAGWALFIDMPRGSARSNLANLGAVQLSRSIINGFADSLLVVFQEIMGIDLIDHLNRC